MKTDKIVEMITASDSVGILHTWFYRALNVDGALYNTAYNNDLNILSGKNSEGFIYDGKYYKLMILEMISAYYQECSDEGDVIPIYDSIIGIDADWQPTEKVSNDMHKCVEKTVKEWATYLKNISTHKLIEYFDDSELVNESNVEDVRYSILDWLSDPGGAQEMIKATMIYEAVRLLEDNINELNEII